MIKPILFAPGSTDPVFWALKEINIYKMELYKLRKKHIMEQKKGRGWPVLSGDFSFDEIKNHICYQLSRLNKLISIGMNGRAIDNRETRPP